MLGELDRDQNRTAAAQWGDRPYWLPRRRAISECAATEVLFGSSRPPHRPLSLMNTAEPTVTEPRIRLDITTSNPRLVAGFERPGPGRGLPVPKVMSCDRTCGRWSLAP